MCRFFQRGLTSLQLHQSQQSDRVDRKKLHLSKRPSKKPTGSLWKKNKKPKVLLDKILLSCESKTKDATYHLSNKISQCCVVPQHHRVSRCWEREAGHGWAEQTTTDLIQRAEPGPEFCSGSDWTHTSLSQPASGPCEETGAPAEFQPLRIFLLRADCANHCSAVNQTVLPPFVGHVFMTYNGNHEVRETFLFVTVNFKQLFVKE